MIGSLRHNVHVRLQNSKATHIRDVIINGGPSALSASISPLLEYLDKDYSAEVRRYVCVYACMHACVCACYHSTAEVRRYVCVYVCMHVCMCLRVSTRQQKCAGMYVCVCVCDADEQ